MQTEKGRAIWQARKAKKWSQEVLARGLCDRSTISRIENGEYEPPNDLWNRLAERLNISRANTDPQETTPPHTAIKQIRMALVNHRSDEAIRLASITFHR